MNFILEMFGVVPYEPAIPAEEYQKSLVAFNF